MIEEHTNYNEEVRRSVIAALHFDFRVAMSKINYSHPQNKLEEDSANIQLLTHLFIKLRELYESPRINMEKFNIITDFVRSFPVMKQPYFNAYLYFLYSLSLSCSGPAT